MRQVEHELHHRRRSRNMGTLFTLLAFVALLMGLTMVKISQVPPTASTVSVP